MEIVTMTRKMVSKDATVAREGDKIIIPEGMDYDEAITWLNRRKTEEERVVSVREQVDAYPFDGAHALMKALASKYGWVNLVPTPGFFGDNPPAMISIEVGFGKTIQVPWGRIQIPKVDGYIETAFDLKDGRFIFCIIGSVRQKHKGAVAEIAKLTRKFVKEESIYRGKAVRVSFDAEDQEKRRFDPNDCPRFLDLSSVKVGELIFSAEVERQIHISLFTPVEKTKACRAARIPLKRGVLLEGPYGTGKTQTAYVAAKKCTENGWTFVYLQSVTQLRKAILFASQYQPCMIFAEDIDRVMEGDDRDDEMDEILNTIDGIESKDTETVVVLTTNHVEKINQAMLRPGRLDAVITVKPPDADAVARLVKLFGRGLIRENDDYTAVGVMLNGQIPAVVREVVERAKLASVSRGHMDVAAVDLEDAAQGMLDHLKLLQPKMEDNRTQIERFGAVIGEALVNGVTQAVHQAGDLPRGIAMPDMKALPVHKGNGRLDKPETKE